jgi:hypothetical protein
MLEDILMKRKLFIILLFVSPIFFFLGHRLLHVIFPPERSESLKYEIIGAIVCGYGASFGLWSLDRKSRKEKESQTIDPNDQ